MDNDLLLRKRKGKKKNHFGIKTRPRETAAHTHTHTYTRTHAPAGTARSGRARGELIRSAALASRSESSPAAGRAELWKVNWIKFPLNWLGCNLPRELSLSKVRIRRNGFVPFLEKGGLQAGVFSGLLYLSFMLMSLGTSREYWTPPVPPSAPPPSIHFTFPPNQEM